jgi:signal peptidase
MTSTTSRVPGAGPAAGESALMHNGWRVAGRAASSVITVVVAMVAALAAVIATATHFARDGQYTAFGHPVMTVLSGSMTPVIRTGDLIVDNPVTAAQARDLHVGQIISVREAPGSQAIITHRIIAVTVSQGAVNYVTKGDANNAPDTPLRPASDVIGVFRFAIPRGGYVLAALHRPLVLGLLLASPVLWFLAGPLFQLARRLDEPDAGAWAEPARPKKGPVEKAFAEKVRAERRAAMNDDAFRKGQARPPP